VDSGSRAVRDQYREEVLTLRRRREERFRRMDTQFLDIRTDASYVEPLVRFFHKRELRR
jgi:hypothetical protein